MNPPATPSPAPSPSGCSITPEQASCNDASAFDGAGHMNVPDGVDGLWALNGAGSTGDNVVSVVIPTASAGTGRNPPVVISSPLSETS